MGELIQFPRRSTTPVRITTAELLELAKRVGWLRVPKYIGTHFIVIEDET